MSRVEVDLNQLAAAVSEAILKFAQPPGESLLKPEAYSDDKDTYLSEEDREKYTKPKKKRGRPKKNKDLPIKSESEPVVQTEQLDFTAPAKKSDFVIQHDPDKKIAKRIPFKKRKRTNQWIDDLSLATNALYNNKGEKIIYPPHTPPREAQEEQQYLCDNCGKKFMAFPSYIPPSIEGHQPMIRCYNCNTK